MVDVLSEIRDPDSNVVSTCARYGLDVAIWGEKESSKRILENNKAAQCKSFRYASVKGRRCSSCIAARAHNHTSHTHTQNVTHENEGLY